MGVTNRDLAYLSTEEIRTKHQTAAPTLAGTSLTGSEPGSPDYAIQDLTTSTPYGFVTANEAQTVLTTLINVQARVNEIEAVLADLDLIVPTVGA